MNLYGVTYFPFDIFWVVVIAVTVVVLSDYDSGKYMRCPILGYCVHAQVGVVNIQSKWQSYSHPKASACLSIECHHILMEIQNKKRRK